MGTIQSIHTFTEGMDKDTHPQYKSKTSYDHAENLRYYANKDGSTGDLRNVVGSTRVVSYINTETLYGNYLPMHVAGSCIVGQYMVIFASDTFHEWIFRYKDGDTSLTTMYETTIGGLGIWSTSTKLDVVSRYESPESIKVYWAAGNTPLKMANIAKPLTTTGLYDTNYISISRLNLNSTITLSVPVLNKVLKGGRLTTGKVQYAYSLFKKNAQETTISALSLPTPLFTSTSRDNKNKIGDEEIVNVGKSVSVSIDIATSDRTFYDYITLYRVHYNYNNDTPTITIVGNYTISNAATNIVTDIGGDGLGTLTLEEFSILYKSFFTAPTLEEKNNRLFAANTIDTNFDVTFDCRAYRFNSSNRARIDQDYAGTSYLNVTTSNWSTVSTTHSCVLLENGFTAGYPRSICYYIYQSDGSTYGGEGPNVKYAFLQDTSVIDTCANKYNDYNSQENYNDEIQATLKVGYQRGEVYRFGIVFYNNLGQASTVKWVGDIRMPSLSDGSKYSSYFQNPIEYNAGANRIDKETIYLSMTLKSLPANAVGWQVVRARRLENDKTILMTGVVSYTRTKTYSDSVTPANVAVKSGILTCNPLHGWVNSAVDDALQINNRVVSFISPDMFYSPLTIKEGDFVLFEGSMGDSIESYDAPSGSDPVNTNFQEIIKYCSVKCNGWPPHDPVLFSSSITEVAYTSTGNPSNSVGMTNAGTTDEYHHVSYWGPGSLGGTTTENGVLYGEAGSCYTLSLATAVEATADDFTLPYVYIVRDNIGRYGGYTNEDRERTEYISCSGIFSIAGTQGIFGGDTYIGYFGYTNTIYTEIMNDVSITLTRRLSNHVLLPMESQVNLDLTHDINYFRSTKSNRWLIRENAKDVEITSNSGVYKFTPETNLYQYNTVYSTEQNLAYRYSLSERVDPKHNNRVYYSDYKSSDTLKDTWCIFRTNNYLDVDPKFGAITKLQKWNNDIYFFQEKAVGLLPIEQRALVESTSIGALQMGVAGILDYYRYITEFQGLTNAKDIVSASKGIYWYDSNNKAIIRYNGNNVEDLTISCKINSYIKDLNLLTCGTLGYDYKYNEVLFKLGTAEVLVFNEVNDKFVSIYTYTPDCYINTNNSDLYYTINKPYYISNVLSGYQLSMYQGNSSTLSWNYFASGSDLGEGNQVTSLTVTDTDNYLQTKVYDGLRFYTECVGASGNEYNTVTFTSMSANNRYQYTGEVDLVRGTNLERREREYTFALPRNIVNANGTTNIDITDPLNHNTSRTFKERLRDKFLTVTLNKDTASTTSLSIPYLTFVYRISNR